MDEIWLRERLELLGIEDSEVVSSYLSGILESTNGDVATVRQALEPFVSASSDIDEFTEDLARKWSTASFTHATSNSNEKVTADLKSLFHGSLAQRETKPLVAEGKQGLDTEQREATLRMARQIQEQRMLEEMQESNNEDSSDEKSASQLNRAMVQTKIVQAQKAKEASIKEHKAASKNAAAEDKKSKAQKKEERQKRAQKGERRGNG